MEKPPSGAAAAAGAGGMQPSPQFSQDISGMPEAPPRNLGHRRAHSEILTLPDDLSFDSDLGVVGDTGAGIGGPEAPSLSDGIEDDFFSTFLDMDKFNCATSSLAGGSESGAGPSAEMPRARHQHSQSMDGSTMIKAEMLAGSGSGEGGLSSAEAKKAMSAAKLADLALIDPKRAKRIWANRQSAARSKERKMRYIQELERKVQNLQTEATTLSAQLTILQGDTNNLNVENNELKLRVQSMEQQVHLQDELNSALRDEVHRLKLATGHPASQVISNGGQLMNFGTPSFGSSQQFYHQNPAAMQMLTTHQLQQLQIHSQHPQQRMNPHHSSIQLQHQQQSSADLKLKGVISAQNRREESSEGSSTNRSSTNRE